MSEDGGRPTGDRPGRYPSALVIAVLCICGTVVSLQQTLVIPLLPDFPMIFGTSPDTASWLVTITLLTAAVATPILSRLADMFGKRRMMLTSLASVVAGSVLAAMSTGLATAIAGRGLQGLGTALIPIGISIMRDELPRERVASAVALMSATLGIGGAVGLPLAGVLYEHLSWHSLFWVSAGFGAVMLVAVLLVVPESTVQAGGRFDYAGAVLLSLGLTALLLAVSKGGVWGWTSEVTILSFVLAAVFFTAWLPLELRTGQPLVDLRTSARRPVLLTNVASLLLGFAMFANMLATTQQLQMPTSTGYGFGMSVVGAGLAMLPGGLCMVLLAPVAAGISRRWSARVALLGGALTIALGYVMRVFLTDSLTQVVAGATVISAGTAVAYAVMPTLIMRNVPITETASANGLNTLLRGVGTSTSSATIAALLAATTTTVGGVALPTLSGFQAAFWVAAGGALLSAAAAAALPRRRPATAPGADAVAAVPAVREELRKAPRGQELVVRGVVRHEPDHPVRSAVVTVLDTDGDHVDWSRADHDGSYSLVLPGPGRYVVVTTADGWEPHAQVVDVDETSADQHITLPERLQVCGQVTRGGRPAGGVLVSLTRPTGEPVASVHSGPQGVYAIPLPQTGRYVLTVVDLGTGAAASRSLLVASTSARHDIVLDEDARAAPRVTSPLGGGPPAGLA